MEADTNIRTSTASQSWNSLGDRSCDTNIQICGNCARNLLLPPAVFVYIPITKFCGNNIFAR